MDDAGDDTPDAEIGIFSDHDRRVVGICRNQFTGGWTLLKPFYGQFAINDSNNNFTVGRLKRSIDNQDIVMIDTCIFHWIAGNSHKKSSHRMLNEQFVQIKFSINMIFGWRRKSSRNTACEKRTNIHGFLIDFKNGGRWGVCFHVGNISIKSQKDIVRNFFAAINLSVHRLFRSSRYRSPTPSFAHHPRHFHPFHRDIILKRCPWSGIPTQSTESKGIFIYFGR